MPSADIAYVYSTHDEGWTSSAVLYLHLELFEIGCKILPSHHEISTDYEAYTEIGVQCRINTMSAMLP